MSLDPSRVNALTSSGRRVPRPAADPEGPTTPAAPRTAPRTRPYRLTVDLPPAVHTQLSRWVIDLEEQAGHNVDKRAVVLALLDLLRTDDEVAAAVRIALTIRR